MEWGEYLRFVLAFVFVLGLIGLFAWIARKSGFIARPSLRGQDGGRLHVVEVKAVDAKRRLVLVRRDQTEHLILLGASGESVIETGIPADRAVRS